MNGYGHFVPALFWSITYWFAIFAFLGVVSIAYARRGAEDSLARAHAPGARRALRAWCPPPRCFLLVAVGSGAWYFYNAHVLNEYLTAKDRRAHSGRLRTRLQEVRTAAAAQGHRGRRHRQHLSRAPLLRRHRPLHAAEQVRRSRSRRSTSPTQQQSVSNVQFDRPFHLVSQAPRNLYSIYALDQPLHPGEVITLTFTVGTPRPRLPRRQRAAEFAYNGTFFDSGYLPARSATTRISNSTTRAAAAKNISAALEEMAPRGDPVTRASTSSRANSDWITYHTVVSTSGDQIAIAPGYLQRDGSRMAATSYEYSMGSTHILDFFAYLSGRYTVRKEVYSGPNGPVNLEVYYDPAHTYDIDDMLASSRAGLDYYQAHFSPYQFTQYRIMEFPRYRSFAQSFPNTVPYSEGIGFIGRMVRQGRCRPYLLRHRARARPSVVGPPVDRRRRCKAPT